MKTYAVHLKIKQKRSKKRLRSQKSWPKHAKSKIGEKKSRRRKEKENFWKIGNKERVLPAICGKSFFIQEKSFRKQT